MENKARWYEITITAKDDDGTVITVTDKAFGYPAAAIAARYEEQQCRKAGHTEIKTTIAPCHGGGTA